MQREFYNIVVWESQVNIAQKLKEVFLNNPYWVEVSTDYLKQDYTILYYNELKKLYVIKNSVPFPEIVLTISITDNLQYNTNYIDTIDFAFCSPILKTMKLK